MLVLQKVILALEGNHTYSNLNPKGEPQLGKRGLLALAGASSNPDQAKAALLWVLNLSDGQHSLLDIAEKSRLPLGAIEEAVQRLSEKQLLAKSQSEEDASSI